MIATKPATARGPRLRGGQTTSTAVPRGQRLCLPPPGTVECGARPGRSRRSRLRLEVERGGVPHGASGGRKCRCVGSQTAH